MLIAGINCHSINTKIPTTVVINADFFLQRLGANIVNRNTTVKAVDKLNATINVFKIPTMVKAKIKVNIPKMATETFVMITKRFSSMSG